jgi:hypothetical protein
VRVCLIAKMKVALAPDCLGSKSTVPAQSKTES